jgi:hypothetical protein
LIALPVSVTAVQTQEATMKTLSQADTPFSQLLLSWAADRLSRTTTAIKPTHRAGQIAADVAASGNPSGA